MIVDGSGLNGPKSPALRARKTLGQRRKVQCVRCHYAHRRCIDPKCLSETHSLITASTDRQHLGFGWKRPSARCGEVWLGPEAGGRGEQASRPEKARHVSRRVRVRVAVGDVPRHTAGYGTGILTVGLTCNCVAYNHKGRPPPYAHVKWSVEQVERVWRR